MPARPAFMLEPGAFHTQAGAAALENRGPPHRSTRNFVFDYSQAAVIL